jgi:flagellar motility protein MotE (MotC chaperone)
LLVVALLLAGSSVIRIGLVSDARAREAEEAAPSRPAVAETDEAGALLTALQAREERLRGAEAALAERRAAQEIMEQALDRKLAELTAAEQALAATIARAETAAEDDISRLTRVYENMKPANAAALFEAMAPDFAAGFLARMRPEAAAGIMAGLTPQAAYSISALLAGRNARVPTD